MVVFVIKTKQNKRSHKKQNWNNSNKNHQVVFFEYKSHSDFPEYQETGPAELPQTYRQRQGQLKSFRDVLECWAEDSVQPDKSQVSSFRRTHRHLVCISVEECQWLSFSWKTGRELCRHWNKLKKGGWYGNLKLNFITLNKIKWLTNIRITKS